MDLTTDSIHKEHIEKQIGDVVKTFEVRIVEEKKNADNWKVFLDLIGQFPKQYLKDFIEPFIYERYYKKEGCIFYYAYDREKIVGAITFNTTTGELNWLATSQSGDFSSKFIAQKLFQVCFEKALECNMQEVYFEVNTEDAFIPEGVIMEDITGSKRELTPDPAFGRRFRIVRNLYRRYFGFQRWERQENAYGPGQHVYNIHLDRHDIEAYCRFGRTTHRNLHERLAKNRNKNVYPDVYELKNLWMGISMGNPFFEEIPNLIAYTQMMLETQKDKPVYIVVPDVPHYINLRMLYGEEKGKEMIEEQVEKVCSVLRYVILTQFSQFSKTIHVIKVSEMDETSDFGYYSEKTKIIQSYFNQKDTKFREDILKATQYFKNHYEEYQHFSSEELAEYIIHELAILCEGIKNIECGLVYPGFGFIDSVVLYIQKGNRYPELSRDLGFISESPASDLSLPHPHAVRNRILSVQEPNISNYIIPGVFSDNNRVLQVFDTSSDVLMDEFLFRLGQSDNWDLTLAQNYINYCISFFRDEKGIIILSSNKDKNTIDGVGMVHDNGHIVFLEGMGTLAEQTIIKSGIIRQITKSIRNPYCYIPETETCQYHHSGKILDFNSAAGHLATEFIQTLGFGVHSLDPNYYGKFIRNSQQNTRHNGIRLIFE